MYAGKDFAVRLVGPCVDHLAETKGNTLKDTVFVLKPSYRTNKNSRLHYGYELSVVFQVRGDLGNRILKDSLIQGFPQTTRPRDGKYNYTVTALDTTGSKAVLGGGRADVGTYSSCSAASFRNVCDPAWSSRGRRTPSRILQDTCL